MKPFTLNLRGRLVSFDRPAVMGILNATPDSFYAASRACGDEAHQAKVIELLQQKPDIIDVGAYSTRPGALDVPVDQELARLAQAMRVLRAQNAHIPISVDTFRAEVARIAVTELGADIVNDISGTNLDPAMAQTVADMHCPYILGHLRGRPADMMEYAKYEDVTADVLSEIGERVQWLAMLGVNDIIVDPGFGFAKTLRQNYELMHNLEALQLFHRPVMVGISRKSMLTHLLNITPEQALNATTALNMAALQRGAAILRVHDVLAARQAVDVFMTVSEPQTIATLDV